MVELEETQRILKEGDKNSLAIVDELGRGTSTRDGMAIAYGVLKSLAEDSGMLGVFATHFHKLVTEFRHHPRIKLGHMMTAATEKGPQFTYELAEGSCHESLGLKVAEMAGVWPEIIEIARQVSIRLEL
jgi:DNA mismatch repair ATPase MutS